jgi:hypothetical protein
MYSLLFVFAVALILAKVLGLVQITWTVAAFPMILFVTLVVVIFSVFFLIFFIKSLKNKK